MNILNLKAMLRIRITDDIFDGIVIKYLDLSFFLTRAAIEGSLENFKYLVSVGADPLADEGVSIFVAAHTHKLDILKYIYNIPDIFIPNEVSLRKCIFPAIKSNNLCAIQHVLALKTTILYRYYDLMLQCAAVHDRSKIADYVINSMARGDVKTKFELRLIYAEALASRKQLGQQAEYRNIHDDKGDKCGCCVQ